MSTRSQNSRAFSSGSPATMSADATSTGLRAVIYARVSSHAQRDRHTIASQLTTLPAFVSARGWTLVKPAETYLDDGRTAKEGFLAKRTAFTRLIHDASLGVFDVVVVVDLDRLTRSEDLRERGEVLGAFQRAGVQLAVSSTGQMLDLRSSVGDLMSSLGTFFAAEANRKHRERILRGKDEAIRRGKKPAGPTPFGYLYDRETATWTVDPELGPIVVEIFKRVGDGQTCEAISRDLQGRGVPRARPSKSGHRAPGVWNRERVHQIVRARTYLGKWIANKARAQTVDVPPLVDDDLYARADAALLRSGRRGQLRSPHGYLLQGLSTCGLCGGRIVCISSGSWRTRKGTRRNFFYACSRRRRPKPDESRCFLPVFRSDEIDKKVWEAIVHSVIREDLLERATAEGGGDRDRESRLHALARLKARSKHLARAEEIVLERFGRGLITEASLDKELLRLSKDRREVESSIAALGSATNERATREQTAIELNAAIKTLKNRLGSATTEDRRDLVRALVVGAEHAVIFERSGLRASLSIAAASPAVGQVYAAG